MPAAVAIFYRECPVCHDNVPVHELGGGCCDLCRTEREVATLAAADVRVAGGDALAFPGAGQRPYTAFETTLRAEVAASEAKLAEVRRGLLIAFGILIGVLAAIFVVGAVAV